MADYINLEQDEFNPLIEKLTAIHERELEEMRELSEKLRNLIEADSGFHAERISAYTLKMLDMIDQNILPVMEQKFELTETEVKTFIATVNNTDTLCGI